jgi:hypothetical protein
MPAQCTRPTAVRPRLLFIPLGALLVLFMGMSGCVPVPYRPAASVSHTPVGADLIPTGTLEPVAGTFAPSFFCSMLVRSRSLMAADASSRPETGTFVPTRERTLR